MEQSLTESPGLCGPEARRLCRPVEGRYGNSLPLYSWKFDRSRKALFDRRTPRDVFGTAPAAVNCARCQEPVSARKCWVRTSDHDHRHELGELYCAAGVSLLGHWITRSNLRPEGRGLGLRPSDRPPNCVGCEHGGSSTWADALTSSTSLAITVAPPFPAVHYSGAYVNSYIGCRELSDALHE